MAQFRAIIRGNRGDVSRLGSKSSGIVAKVEGWDAGVRVYASHNGTADVFHVYATSGSNGGHVDRLVATIVDGVTVVPADANGGTYVVGAR